MWGVGWKGVKWAGIWCRAPPSSALSPPREGVEPPRNDRAKRVGCGGKRIGPFEGMSVESRLPGFAVVRGYPRQAGGYI
jgi:hypothetical protein